MYANGLQLITIDSDRVVLKRGVHEFMVRGQKIADAVAALLELLDGTKSREQIIASFSADQRAQIDQVLTALVARGFCSETREPAAEVEGAASDLQAAFYRNFGATARPTPERLAAATVVIVGVNGVTRSLVRSLLECGVGKLVLHRHPALDNHLLPTHWATGPSELLAQAGGRLVVEEKKLDLSGLAGATLLCAASDFGEAEALLEQNRMALAAGKPFLPMWLEEITGVVGPLNYPRETACLRCYRLRADSNDPRYDVRRAVRRHITGDPEAAQSIGFLPPMASVVGEIAAMQVLACLGEFVPIDVVGRIIEIGLVSFHSAVRRVLKVPRCPDCSEQARRAPIAVTTGPQIAR
jgi:bacteriocin biosynthesis cyclodehydratase domain-containing protein